MQGRTADVLTFPGEHAEHVSIPALMFEIADTAGVEQFQIVQIAPTTLRVRLRLTTGAAPDDVWPAVHAELTRVLGERHLTHVTVERAEELPQPSPGGKYRAVIPLGPVRGN